MVTMREDQHPQAGTNRTADGVPERARHWLVPRLPIRWWSDPGDRGARPHISLALTVLADLALGYDRSEQGKVAGALIAEIDRAAGVTRLSLRDLR